RLRPVHHGQKRHVLEVHHLRDDDGVFVMGWRHIAPGAERREPIWRHRPVLPIPRMDKLLDVSRRRRLQLAELEENLAALHPWNLREFEIPDVIAFKDFVHSRRSVAESLFAAQSALIWGRALHFPYPNRDKLRQFVVLDA